MQIRLEFALLCLCLSNTVAEMNIDRKSEKKLHQDLFKNYNRNVRPMESKENATSVLLRYNFHSLKEFDDITGHISIAGDFVLAWMDMDLSWNCSDYSGTHLIHLRKNTIWTPTLTLNNPFYEIEQVGNGRPNELVSVRSNGSIYYNPGAVLDAVCHADVTYFPFDSQVCTFKMSAWYYELHELTFEVYNGGIVHYKMGIRSKTENSMWDVQDIILKRRHSKVHIFVTLTRKPLFYVYNIILPINFICLLNIFVFLLPSDSGERVGFSVTMLLSLAVFLTIVSDRLPESSNPSILGLILLLEFSMSGLILVFVIIGLRCYHRDTNTTVPVWIQRIIKCCSKRRNIHQFDRVIDWITVSKLFDFVCFWLFIIMYVAGVLGYVITYCKLI